MPASDAKNVSVKFDIVLLRYHNIYILSYKAEGLYIITFITKYTDKFLDVNYLNN